MSEKPDLPGKNDLPVAFRAIALARGLSGDTKTVAAVIIGHFNSKTGQCDPGTERLMSKAGVSKRTVVNATNELHQRGLVVKVRHGGNGFRTRYQPNWSMFREVVFASEREDVEPNQVQKAALTQCKSVHLDSANPCTLTHVRNSSKKLIHTDRASGRVPDPDQQEPSRLVHQDAVRGLLRGSLKPAYEKRLIPLSVVDAQEAARQDIDVQIEQLGETMKAFVKAGLTPEIQSEAIVAEQKTRGAGIRLIVDRVSRVGAAGRH